VLSENQSSEFALRADVHEQRGAKRGHVGGLACGALRRGGASLRSVRGALFFWLLFFWASKRKVTISVDWEGYAQCNRYHVVALIFCDACSISLLLTWPIRTPFFTTAYRRTGEPKNSRAASTTVVSGVKCITLVFM